jgi:hypothetical protein
MSKHKPAWEAIVEEAFRKQITIFQQWLIDSNSYDYTMTLNNMIDLQREVLIEMGAPEEVFQ